MRRRSRTCTGALLALGFLGLPGPLAAQSGFPPDSAIRAILEARVASGVARGIVVGVLERDGGARYFTAGTAGPGRAALDRYSVFEIGSITKVFTGTLLAEMSLAGEVGLDDPVQRYLPEGVRMPARGERRVTLAQLGSQTSGLPRLPGNLRPGNIANPYADYSVTQMYEFLTGHALARDPGVQYEYSNLGVGLLGHVLALRAGKPYEALVGERILGPLGMTSTAVTLTPRMREHVVAGHNAAGDTVALWDLPTLAGAGALRSNAEDMLRFLAANVRPGGDRLGQAMRTAHRRRAQAGAPAMSIGLAWHRLSVAGDTLVWHNGGTGGFRTFAGFRPSTGTAVVVLTNSGGQGSDDIGFHLLNAAVPLAAAPRRIP
jgi:CubicO group peptidase (beta-lactamase class C family)